MEMIEEISQVKFNRAAVPLNAVSTDLDTVDFGNASKSIACVAVYVRYLLKNGEYSSQLIFG